MSADSFEPSGSASPSTSQASEEVDKFKVISDNLLKIVNHRFAEHSEWMQQWYGWANGVMMQMQPIPPQAFRDFDMQSQRLMQFVFAFKPIAEALKAEGHSELTTLIKNTEKGAQKTQESFQAAQQAMARDNFKTQQNIWKMNQKTNQEILRMQQDTHKNQVSSFNRSHNDFLNYIRS